MKWRAAVGTALVLTLAGCGHWGAPTPPSTVDVVEARAIFDKAAEAADPQYKASQTTLTTPEQFNLVSEAGMNEIDRLCQSYWDGVAIYRADARFNKTALGVGGGIAASVLALAKSSAKTIAITAGGVAAGIALIDSYGAEYLMTKYPPETSRLVFEAMRNFRAARRDRSASKPTTMADAHEIISKYARNCSPSGIEDFIREAIQRTGAHAEVPPSEPILGVAYQPVVSVMATLLGVSDLTISQLALVTWHVTDATDAEKKAIEAQLPPAMVPLLTTNKVALQSQAQILKSALGFSAYLDDLKNKTKASASTPIPGITQTFVNGAPVPPRIIYPQMPGVLVPNIHLGPRNAY